MMDTKVHSLNTKLKDRTLWFDGDSSVKADELTSIINKVRKPFVDELTDDIIQYNSLVSEDQQINIKKQCNEIVSKWNLPTEYSNIDPWEYIMEQLVEYLAKHNLIDNDGDLTVGGKKRTQRILAEIKLFKQLKMDNIIRTIIFIINTLTTHNIVWGVGRGSSVSSYTLYILGVHDIDSYKYGLEIDEFLHL